MPPPALRRPELVVLGAWVHGPVDSQDWTRGLRTSPRSEALGTDQELVVVAVNRPVDDKVVSVRIRSSLGEQSSAPRDHDISACERAPVFRPYVAIGDSGSDQQPKAHETQDHGAAREAISKHRTGDEVAEA